MVDKSAARPVIGLEITIVSTTVASAELVLAFSATPAFAPPSTFVSTPTCAVASTSFPPAVNSSSGAVSS